MANGSTSIKKTPSEKSNSLSSDILRRIPPTEIHVRYHEQREADVILWSGYGVAWIRGREFIRLTPYFSSYQEAVDAQVYRRFQSTPPMQPEKSTHTLIKDNGRRSATVAARRSRPVPQKRFGFAVDKDARFKGNDLTNQVFGKLVAVSALVGTIRYGHRVWICRCSCGEHVHIRATDLMCGRKTSCGCDKVKSVPVKTPIIQEDSMQRRDLILGIMAAPAIVRASSLMRVRTFVPDWIRAHRNNPLFGELIVRRPGVEKLGQFADLIRPGEFLWKAPDGKLIDLCMFDRSTFVEITPRFLSVRHSAHLVGTGYALCADQENVQAGNLIEYTLDADLEFGNPALGRRILDG